MKYLTCAIFSFSPTPTFVLMREKNLRKYEVSINLKQSFILIKEVKTFVDFMIIDIQLFSFDGFYFNKVCMMRKLH